MYQSNNTANSWSENHRNHCRNRKFGILTSNKSDSWLASLQVIANLRKHLDKFRIFEDESICWLYLEEENLASQVKFDCDAQKHWKQDLEQINPCDGFLQVLLMKSQLFLANTRRLCCWSMLVPKNIRHKGAI